MTSLVQLVTSIKFALYTQDSWAKEKAQRTLFCHHFQKQKLVTKSDVAIPTCSKSRENKPSPARGLQALRASATFRAGSKLKPCPLKPRSGPHIGAISSRSIVVVLCRTPSISSSGLQHFQEVPQESAANSKHSLSETRWLCVKSQHLVCVTKTSLFSRFLPIACRFLANFCRFLADETPKSLTNSRLESLRLTGV